MSEEPEISDFGAWQRVSSYPSFITPLERELMPDFVRAIMRLEKRYNMSFGAIELDQDGQTAGISKGKISVDTSLLALAAELPSKDRIPFFEAVLLHEQSHVIHRDAPSELSSHFNVLHTRNDTILELSGKKRDDLSPEEKKKLAGARISLGKAINGMSHEAIEDRHRTLRQEHFADSYAMKRAERPDLLIWYMKKMAKWQEDKNIHDFDYKGRLIADHPPIAERIALCERALNARLKNDPALRERIVDTGLYTPPAAAKEVDANGQAIRSIVEAGPKRGAGGLEKKPGESNGFADRNGGDGSGSGDRGRQ